MRPGLNEMVAEKLKPHLRAGERLLWADAPDPKARTRRNIAWGAGSAAVLVLAAGVLAALSPIGTSAGLELGGATTRTILLVVAGIAAAGSASMLYSGDYRMPADLYGLTDKRLLALHDGRADHITAVAAGTPLTITRGAHSEARNRGSIEIQWAGGEEGAELLDIADPAGVETLIRAMLSTAADKDRP